MIKIAKSDIPKYVGQEVYFSYGWSKPIKVRLVEGAGTYETYKGKIMIRGNEGICAIFLEPSPEGCSYCSHVGMGCVESLYINCNNKGKG